MTRLLESLTDHPEMDSQPAPIDLLSQVLGQIRLTGDRVFAQTLAAGSHVDLVAEASHVCIVVQGGVQVLCGNGALVTAEAGELVLLPRGATKGRLAAPGAAASLLVGRFSFDPESLRGIAFSLPPCIRISRAEGQGWLEGLIHFLSIEAEDVQPGANLMISRLIDLAVIRTLRTWVQQHQTTGWLGGIADPRIARSLKALHDDPMRPWSIAALAAIAGMSRSNFCDQFAGLVGRAPLRYRNDIRLNLARDMLTEPGARAGEVGIRAGYESEAAFSRAYKAHFGRPPSADARGRSPT